MSVNSESTRKQAIKEVFALPIGEGSWNHGSGLWQMSGPGVKWNTEAAKQGEQVFDIVETTWLVDLTNNDVWPGFDAGILWCVYFCPDGYR